MIVGFARACSLDRHADFIDRKNDLNQLKREDNLGQKMDFVS